MRLLVYHQEREDESVDRTSYWYGIVDLDTGKDTGPIFCEYEIAVDRANKMKKDYEDMARFMDGKNPVTGWANNE